MITCSCRSVRDGITCEVVEGTDQYTLTREQLMKKEDKRGRTREYQIILNYNGAWFPLSQGLSVCCHPPCTDEPRIPLSAGDMVRVTRWKKHWLYGEKEQVEEKERPMVSRRVIYIVAISMILQGRLRGWFPRQCAVEKVEHEDRCMRRQSRPGRRTSRCKYDKGEATWPY